MGKFKMLYISKCYFITAFGQQIQKYERLELIDGDYSNKHYKRFVMIDVADVKDHQPTVTITNDLIDENLSVVTEKSVKYYKKQIRNLEIATREIKINSVLAAYCFIDFIPINWIDMVWYEDPYIIVKFNEKWNNFIVNEGFASYNAFISFFNDLDDNNKRKLANWIADWHLQESIK